MQQRPFGTRSGFSVPFANIGAMRLPKDLDEAVALIRHAIDSGMHYIDTSRGYGESEIKLGAALKDGYREKVILSTKWSPWITNIEESDDTSADCLRKRIEESMTRLQVDYLDFYQVWNIDSREHYDLAVAKGGMVDGIRKAMDEGLVGHTGFTTHDSVENLLTYIDEVDWCEIILFTYNLLFRRYAPAIEAAHKRGIGTVVMNPVGGGMLNNTSPVLQQFAADAGAVSVPDLGLRYLLSHGYIDAIISGISKTSDVNDTLASIERGPLSAESFAVINQRLDSVHQGAEAFCTGCRYCMPCPQEIDIPAVMSLISQQRFWGFDEVARSRYAGMKTPTADVCVRCGACEGRCPQHLGIMDEMAYAAKTFSVGEPLIG